MDGRQTVSLSKSVSTEWDARFSGRYSWLDHNSLPGTITGQISWSPILFLWKSLHSIKHDIALIIGVCWIPMWCILPFYANLNFDKILENLCESSNFCEEHNTETMFADTIILWITIWFYMHHIHTNAFKDENCNIRGFFFCFYVICC